MQGTCSVSLPSYRASLRFFANRRAQTATPAAIEATYQEFNARLFGTELSRSPLALIDAGQSITSREAS